MATSALHATFCENIRARRTELGLTQRDAARRLNVAAPTYSDYEKGRNDPSLALMNRICQALNMDLVDALREPVGAPK